MRNFRLAKENGKLKPLGTALHDSYQDALKNGLGDLDIIAILKYLAEQQ